MGETASFSFFEVAALAFIVQEVAVRHDVGVDARFARAFVTEEFSADVGLEVLFFPQGGAPGVAFLFASATSGGEPIFASFKCGLGDGAVLSFVRNDDVLVLFLVDGGGDGKLFFQGEVWVLQLDLVEDS